MAVPQAITDSFYTVHQGEPAYRAACQFTRSLYQSRLECRLATFYPTLNVLEGDTGIESVCGLREAGKGPLFLENYLDGPIESFLTDVPRDGIIEIGGFAASSRLAALRLMGLTAISLREAGFQTVVCTANRAIRGCLHKLGIPFEELAPASVEKVSGSSTDEWGRYYETAPLVLAGSICEGAHAIEHFA